MSRMQTFNFVAKNAKAAEPDDRIWVNDFSESAASKFGSFVFKITDRDPNEPILVCIDSYGGEIHGLDSMMSVMDSTPNPFVTIATGKAMSAAAVLLSHGDIRCVGQHARVMIHEAFGGALGRVKEVVDQTAELAAVNDYFVQRLADNCGKTVKQLRALWSKRPDIYMSPAEAVKFGIADRIGIPILERRLSYDLRFTASKK